MRWFSRRFLAAASVVFATVVAAGWFTDLRNAAHAALLTVAVAAFLPLVIVSAGIAVAALGFVASIVGTLLGNDPPVVDGLEAGVELADAGVSTVGPYYRWLARRRHPVFWGSAFGLTFGTLGLLGLIAALVLPGEARTVEALASAQRQVESHRKEHGSYPETGGPWLDGFGRPMTYEVRKGLLSDAYRIASFGYDGKPGRDDLSVEADSRKPWTDTVAHTLLEGIRSLRR